MRSYISRLDAAKLTAPGPRSLVILGATGSIGQSALQVVDDEPDRFRLLGLAGARRIDALAELAAARRPPVLAVLDEAGRQRLRALLPPDYAPEILVGPAGYAALAALPEADLVLSAIVGAAGLTPTLAAVRAGKVVALANKESLVLAGDLIRAECAASGAVLLPVDSEHNALFQSMAGHGGDGLEKLILTASGGPFRGRRRAELAEVGPAQALKHPNWSMGAKITIDSATLMNKGLEFIEAHHLFGLPAERIEVVVHPQSIVHSLVQYHDGSLLAQLGPPDMRVAIAYCLGYPERLPLAGRIDLAAIGQLTFEAPDLESFPCLRLAQAALAAGPGCPVVLNAANEVAVELFLRERIGFLDIPALIERAMDDYLSGSGQGAGDAAAILALDGEIRAKVRAWSS